MRVLSAHTGPFQGLILKALICFLKDQQDWEKLSPVVLDTQRTSVQNLRCESLPHQSLSIHTRDPLSLSRDRRVRKDRKDTGVTERHVTFCQTVEIFSNKAEFPTVPICFCTISTEGGQENNNGYLIHFSQHRSTLLVLTTFLPTAIQARRDFLR